MGVVFVVLALLALSIKGISLLDKEAAPAPAASAAAVAPAPPPAPASASGDITGEQVAAIAVALAPAPPPRPASASGDIAGEQVAAIAVALALSEPKSASFIPPSVPRSGESAGSWLQSGRMRALGSNSSGARERRN